MNRPAFLVGTAAAAVAPVLGNAQTLSLQDAIVRLFTAPALNAAWFSSAVLQLRSLEAMRAIVADVADVLGPYRSIAPNAPNSGHFTVTFARGSLQVWGILDASGAIDGLRLSGMQGPAALQRLTALFDTNPTPATWFSARMLAAVPIEKTQLVLSSLEAKYGAFQKATPSKDGSYDVEFVNGGADAQIYLNGEGKIDFLVFQPH